MSEKIKVRVFRNNGHIVRVEASTEGLVAERLWLALKAIDGIDNESEHESLLDGFGAGNRGQSLFDRIFGKAI